MTEIDAAAEAATAPRRWWVALPLAIFGAGAAGYLYVGRLRRAAVAAIAFLVFGLALKTGLGGWVATPAGFFAFLALQLGFALFVIFDAIRIARKERAYIARPFNRGWIYVAIVVVAAGVAMIFTYQPAVRTFKIASASMAPTFHVGDRVVADTHARTPTRGAVVMFALPRDPSITYVSRVVGLPGDRIQLNGGVVRINDVPVALIQMEKGAEPEVGTIYRETFPEGGSHLLLDRVPDGTLDDTGVYEVPADAYFMMGDNRDNATDSRVPENRYGVGSVPAGNIIATARFIYWSGGRLYVDKNVE